MALAAPVIEEQAQCAPALPLPQEIAAEVPLRRFTKTRRSTISSDYVVYLGEADYDIGHVQDPETYEDAITGPQSDLWKDTMIDEMHSMGYNKVWELIELPESCKPFGCKWIYKTKKDSKGNIERFKARLVTKGYTQRREIE